MGTVVLVTLILALADACGEQADVVGVHRDRAGDGLFETVRERRLAAGTAPVEGDDPRVTDRRASGVDHELREVRQALDSPRTRSRLTLPQDHRHSDIVAREPTSLGGTAG